MAWAQAAQLAASYLGSKQGGGSGSGGGLGGGGGLTAASSATSGNVRFAPVSVGLPVPNGMTVAGASAPASAPLFTALAGSPRNAELMQLLLLGSFGLIVAAAVLKGAK